MYIWEHGFSVDECVMGLCELQAENAALRARVARLEEALKEIAEMKIPYCDGDDVAHSMRDTAKSAMEEK